MDGELAVEKEEGAKADAKGRKRGRLLRGRESAASAAEEGEGAVEQAMRYCLSASRTSWKPAGLRKAAAAKVCTFFCTVLFVPKRPMCQAGASYF